MFKKYIFNFNEFINSFLCHFNLNSWHYHQNYFISAKKSQNLCRLATMVRVVGFMKSCLFRSLCFIFPLQNRLGLQHLELQVEREVADHEFLFRNLRPDFVVGFFVFHFLLLWMVDNFAQNWSQIAGIERLFLDFAMESTL